MSLTWNAAEPPALPRPTAPQKLRMALRAVVLVLATYGGMIPVLILNLIERWLPLGLSHRIVCLWGGVCLWLCGVRLRRVGAPMDRPGAIVANHVGWIDIFTLLAADRVYFVSKAEVSGWPLVGWLSRQIGTLYIERRRTASATQAAQVRSRLLAGDRLCFFPEGTSTDGRRVLPFRSTIFAAFEHPTLKDWVWVQPVSLDYRPSPGLPDVFFGWWGKTPLGPHVQAVFALSAGSEVVVTHHTPLRMADYPDRKALAAACEAAVRSGVRSAEPA